MIDLVLSKKLMFFMALFCLSVMGTVTQVYGQTNTTPSWIKDFPPDDELWGIGTAKLVNSRNSRDLAELRARVAIVRQLYSRVTERAHDDEFNTLYWFFMDYISIEASFEIMNATRVLRTWEAPDGTSWCLVALHKSDAIKYLSIIQDLYQEYYNEVF
jgi:hypothetical protein